MTFLILVSLVLTFINLQRTIGFFNAHSGDERNAIFR